MSGRDALPIWRPTPGTPYTILSQACQKTEAGKVFPLTRCVPDNYRSLYMFPSEARITFKETPWVPLAGALREMHAEVLRPAIAP